MELTGTVTNGVVVLDNGNSLPEGARVRVTLAAPESTAEKAQALGQRWRRFAGTIEGLPSDLAENHDYYLHGMSKR
jgi:hypothetical protein